MNTHETDTAETPGDAGSGADTRWMAPAIVLITACLLLPFANRAFHIDDPFYVWVAQHIVNDPLDFYGFSLNWQGRDEPVAEINKNPPGVSYYIAIIGLAFGWSETTLHIALLLPAVAVALGAYALAQHFTPRRFLATLVALITPVFVLSGSNVMAEMTMFAFYLWAVICWVLGLDRQRWSLLIAAGFLVGLSGLTKYFGISAVPLLLAHGLVEKRGIGLWALALLIPIAMFGGYEAYTAHLYGRGHVSEAIFFARTEQVGLGEIPAYLRFVTGLCFLGACLLPVLFFTPLLWGTKTLIAGLLAALALAGVLYAGLMGRFFAVGPNLDDVRLLYVLQFSVFVAGGVHVLALGAMDWLRIRDAKSTLLVLWLFGTFLFAAQFNWAINGRSLLPAIVPAGILVARRLDLRRPLLAATRVPMLYAPLVPAVCIALAISWADYVQANSVRAVAKHIMEHLAPESGTVWYQGHWGFQFYMDQYGAEHLNSAGTFVRNGDIVVTPRYTVSSHEMAGGLGKSSQIIEVPTVPWLAVWNPERGAGYYSDGWGPAPFVFLDVPPDRYTLVTLDYTGMIKPTVTTVDP